MNKIKTFYFKIYNDVENIISEIDNSLNDFLKNKLLIDLKVNTVEPKSIAEDYEVILVYTIVYKDIIDLTE